MRFVAGRLTWDLSNGNHADIAEVARFLLQGRAGRWRNIPWQPYPVPAGA
ncbi:hypothetical protein [Hymenobacter metallicola]|nr:hypothetical protein [Hymenobacter metallicola]